MRDKATAILYTRVSTAAQAEHGYSLREQAERLGCYCEHNGLEVLEVVEDAGVSGAAFDRPGLNRVRELVAGHAGRVSVVLATERDRFAREPAYLYLLKKEFDEHGCKLRSLNDQGDDSPVGELTAGMLDQIAKFYRAMFAAKSVENKRKKAREGKASGSGTPPFGFRYSADRRSLEVDETRMVVVRRVFSMVAEGATLYSVKKAFEGEGVPTPGGGKYWYPVSMARMVRNDAYLPHSLDELRALGVDEGVLAALDADSEVVYGIWWYGQNRVKLTPDSQKRRRFEELPEDTWIGVPTPHSGLSRGVVEAARKNLSDSYRPRKPAEHYAELRGLLHCQECGLRLTTYTTGKDKTTGKKYAHYACQTQRRHGVDACPAGPRLPAEATEGEVLRYVEELLEDPREIVRRMDEAIESERATQGAYARDSGTTEQALVEKLVELAGKREKLMDLALDGAFDKDEIAKRAAALDEEAASVERLLQYARDAAGRVEKLQHVKRALVEAFETGLKLGISWMPPQLRREVYEALGLRVVVDGAGRMHAEARVDTTIIRFSRQVERYAYALREADERLRREEFKNPPAGYKVTLADPEGNPATLSVTAHQERLERAERELDQVRRELSSSSVTAITSSEMSKLA